MNHLECRCGAQFWTIWQLREHRAEAHPVRYEITATGKLRLLGRMS